MELLVKVIFPAVEGLVGFRMRSGYASAARSYVSCDRRISEDALNDLEGNLRASSKTRAPDFRSLSSHKRRHLVCQFD